MSQVVREGGFQKLGARRRPARRAALARAFRIGCVSVLGVFAALRTSTFPRSLDDDHDGEIGVRLVVEERRIYEGQEFPARVVAIAGKRRPTLEWPETLGIQHWPRGSSLRTVGASSIGPVVEETTEFVYRFGVVIEHAGSVRLPVITARDGERTARSQPMTITARRLPIEGRTGSFLGGVGTIDLRASVQPKSVKTGETVEYIISLFGPGARRSTGVPGLAELAKAASEQGFAVGPWESDAVADPPSRTFRTRLRAKRPGTVALPQVEVATFDPALERYVTRRAPQVRFSVVEQPSFDSSTLSYGQNAGQGEGARWAIVIVTAAPLAGLLAALAIAVARKRRRALVPRRICLRLLDELKTPRAAAVLADHVSNALVSYLSCRTHRPSGALTPDEAGVELERATSDPSLAARGVALIRLCDRARYAPREAPAEPLRTLAREFFRELARTPRSTEQSSFKPN